MLSFTADVVCMSQLLTQVHFESPSPMCTEENVRS